MRTPRVSQVAGRASRIGSIRTVGTGTHRADSRVRRVAGCRQRSTCTARPDTGPRDADDVSAPIVETCRGFLMRLRALALAVPLIVAGGLFVRAAPPTRLVPTYASGSSVEAATLGPIGPGRRPRVAAPVAGGSAADRHRRVRREADADLPGQRPGAEPATGHPVRGHRPGHPGGRLVDHQLPRPDLGRQRSSTTPTTGARPRRSRSAPERSCPAGMSAWSASRWAVG